MPRSVAPVAPVTLAAGETPANEVEFLSEYVAPSDAATTATQNTVKAMIDAKHAGARVRVLSDEVQTMVNRWQRVASALGHRAKWIVESQDTQDASEPGGEPIKFTTGVFTLTKRPETTTATTATVPATPAAPAAKK